MSQVRASPPKTKAVVAVGAAAPEAGGALAPRWLLAACSGLVAAWLAAGSTGLLGNPLRHALTWLAAITSILAAWPADSSAGRRVVSIGGILLSIALLISTATAINVLGVALIMTSLAWGASGAPRRMLVAIATAGLVLGVYRLAYTSIPAVWYLADYAGGVVANLAAKLCGTPLSVGSTFGGVDYLVAMLALYAGLLIVLPRPRMRFAVYVPLAILIVHLTYLIILAIVPTLLPPLPPPPPPSAIPTIEPKQVFSFVETIRPFVPWNIPAIGAILHAGLAAVILRWTIRPAALADAAEKPICCPAISPAALVAAATLLAALIPITSALYTRKPSLEGKKIVLYEKGFLNWMKPKHGDYGRLSIGMYGMAPEYLSSLGAEVVVTPNLSDEELKDASVVAFFFPNKEWEAGQVERVQKFVENGGAMLVLGEHTTHEDKDGKKVPVIGDRANSRFNDLLQGMPQNERPPAHPWSGMYIPFDSATFEIGGWLQSYEQMAHPTSLGIRDDRNQLGVVIGASVKARFPAEPFIVGRWGYNDPGDEGSAAAMMGNHRYDPGERLGDILLAAEQRIGKGKVVAFGDTSGFTNGITYGAHVFTSRFWAYLADGQGSGHPIWRQVLGILAVGGLLGIILLRPSERAIAAAALAMSASLTLCIGVSNAASEQLPDGRKKTPNNLAYITTSHLEASSEESWRPDGTMGLAMNLMRNGYLTLAMPEMTAERLERAALVVCVGPQREFTPAQCVMIQRFVDNGGIFILTAGYDCHEASEPLLKQFGFYIGNKPDEFGNAAPPEPMGHFKSPYINLGDYMPHVRFHAAWPVGYLGGKDASTRIVANGPKNLPVIMARRFGRGTFVLVGDTGFAMNKNLEWEDGRPFDGMRENADFWRWFLTDLTEQPRWIPPKQIPVTQPAGGGQ
ncbi:MAG TPA: hypothetical protein VGQ99_22710 [Tepidisphaeraceae bacterium]|nr:hypothetical protein [Tepidisphaeraceae bacterium]